MIVLIGQVLVWLKKLLLIFDLTKHMAALVVSDGPWVVGVCMYCDIILLQLEMIPQISRYQHRTKRQPADQSEKASSSLQSGLPKTSKKEIIIFITCRLKSKVDNCKSSIKPQ